MSDEPYEYRVCCKDNSDTEPDVCDETYADLEEAHHAAELVLNYSDPPYDEVWIERRPCVEWERLP